MSCGGGPQGTSTVNFFLVKVVEMYSYATLKKKSDQLTTIIGLGTADRSALFQHYIASYAAQKLFMTSVPDIYNELLQAICI